MGILLLYQGRFEVEQAEPRSAAQPALPAKPIVQLLAEHLPTAADAERGLSGTLIEPAQAGFEQGDSARAQVDFCRAAGALDDNAVVRRTALFCTLKTPDVAQIYERLARP